MTLSTYLGYQLYGQHLAQSVLRTAAEPAVSADQAYYNANIGKVKTVSDLVNNFRLLTYATKAFGLSDMTYAKALLTNVLKSDLSNSHSVANQLHDSRYTAFAAAFNFKTDGTLAAPLQTTSQQSSTEALFKATTTLSTAAAASATTAYETAMASITSISQLEKSPAALGYVLIAYGIDPSSASSTFEQTLESDLSDKTSFLNQKPDSGFLALSQAFNVSATGTQSSATEAQTNESITATTTAYLNAAKTDTASQTAAKTETTYFLSKISGITSVSALVGDKRLVAYLKQAFGLPSNADATSITAALTSDLTSKTSYANTAPFPSYLAMAKAFNFTTTGAAGPLPFQTTTQQAKTVQLYMQRQTSDTAGAAAATTYFNANIGKVTSVSGLLNDPSLLKYVTTAYGIDPSTPNATIASVLENTAIVGGGYLALQNAVSLNADGSAQSLTVAQTDANIAATTKAYMSAAGTDAASQKTATTETNYFLSQIPNIISASGLLSDSRLKTYIITAFHLPNTTSAATLQSILTSDTTDPNSAANSAPSTLALAKAFNFTTSGAAGTVTQIQSSAQQQTTAQLYGERTTASAATAAIETAYYQATIGTITSVSQLQNNSRLTAYMLTAYGVDPQTSASTFAAVLQNTNGIDTGYKTLSNDFNITASGTVSVKAQAQTVPNITAAASAYMSAAGTDQASQDAAATETSYYETSISSITSVNSLVGDSRLVAYLKQAYGLPSDATAASISSSLTSDLSNQFSFANTESDPSYKTMAAAFNFATTGAAQSATDVQSVTQQKSTTQLYAANATTDAATTAAATAYYTAHIDSITSLSDIQNDPKLLSYIATAYGLGANPSFATISSTLEGTNITPSQARNASLLAMNAAFNVDAKGNAASPFAAQSATNITATTTAYMANAKTDAGSQAAAKAATAYYKTAIATVTSVTTLLADPKLVAYVEQAYGIPTTTTSAVLRQVLTSDVTNAKSVASTKGTVYKELAAAFSFSSSGLIGEQTQMAQSKAQLDTVNNAYIEQQMETEAGAQNPGIALALYLQANASKITDAFSILADSKLVTIFQTLLGLPAAATSADIDAQAKTINKNFNLADLKNPTKVAALIQRFSLLYDLNPPASTLPYTTTSLLSGGTSALDVTSLFGVSSTSSSTSATSSLTF